MLVKCVCANCAHSYLGDDSMGELVCPRCGVGNESARNPGDVPDAPAGLGHGTYDMHDDPYGYSYEEDVFAPQAPPPMLVNNERFFRGVIMGGLATGILGFAMAGAMAAIQFAIPAVCAVVIALVAGGMCRYGFGGRCAQRTQIRAIAAVFLAVLLGFGGTFVGAWAVERYTGERADAMRDDLDRGLRALTAEQLRVGDEGTRLLLDSRIREIKRLQGLNDASLEDYLWTQEAQVNHGLLAYGKLRATEGPIVRLGANANPVELAMWPTLGILLAEFLLAVVFASRAVLPR